jgi:hypothetical protein
MIRSFDTFCPGEIAFDIGYQAAAGGFDIGNLGAGVVERDDEPEMMPVLLTSPAKDLSNLRVVRRTFAGSQTAFIGATPARKPRWQTQPESRRLSFLPPVLDV